MAEKPYIIALEEHYLDPEVKQLGPTFRKVAILIGAPTPPGLQARI